MSDAASRLRLAQDLLNAGLITSFPEYKEVLDGTWVAEMDKILEDANTKVEQCECGAHKTGIARGQAGHSSWCPWVSA